MKKIEKWYEQISNYEKLKIDEAKKLIRKKIPFSKKYKRRKNTKERGGNIWALSFKTFRFV